jgi:hypothetical protein
MYSPSQKTAPVGPLQSLSQLAGRTLVVQSMVQSMFDCTMHEPLQLAVHWVAQLAVGGVVLHWTWQRLLQSAAQSEAQAEAWACPAQTPEHCALQSDSQAAEQLNVPGLAPQLVRQLVSHGAVQDALALALHELSHAAMKLAGLHPLSQAAGEVMNMQSPDVVRLHAPGPGPASAAEDTSMRETAHGPMKEGDNDRRMALSPAGFGELGDGAPSRLSSPAWGS